MDDKQKIKIAISELELAIDCIETFKKKNNWKLCGFEIPIHNALKYLQEGRSISASSQEQEGK